MMKITLGRLQNSTENERIHDMSFTDAGRPAVLRTKRNKKRYRKAFHAVPISILQRTERTKALRKC